MIYFHFLTLSPLFVHRWCLLISKYLNHTTITNLNFFIRKQKQYLQLKHKRIILIKGSVLQIILILIIIFLFKLQRIISTSSLGKAIVVKCNIKYLYVLTYVGTNTCVYLWEIWTKVKSGYLYMKLEYNVEIM